MQPRHGGGILNHTRFRALSNGVLFPTIDEERFKMDSHVNRYVSHWSITGVLLPGGLLGGGKGMIDCTESSAEYCVISERNVFCQESN
ncbi:hypothetical protein CEXT_215311 [Caerostris extrusa]|uniref:Uncharacterized protein n=1 Tax=Caerostris extrusa TaxID=172846 RepID=A0AAV4WM54_CAEEX|nr:hypothetical protein CEXT_215311 [Caerostris extrusa]